MRKLLEFSKSNWKYGKNEQKVERIGTIEEALFGTDVEATEIAKRDQQAKEQLEQQAMLREIAERHITEFAGDQHTDFAQVLGLPEVTAENLLKKNSQQDPLVLDAMREHATFAK